MEREVGCEKVHLWFPQLGEDLFHHSGTQEPLLLAFLPGEGVTLSIRQSGKMTGNQGYLMGAADVRNLPYEVGEDGRFCPSPFYIEYRGLIVREELDSLTIH